MCFAVAAVLKTMEVMETAQAGLPKGLNEAETIENIKRFPNRYHIAPRQWHWMIYQERGKTIIAQARWFIQMGPIENINLTSEKLLTEPKYKRDLEEHRCLIPVSGFFEENKKVKPPQYYYFYHPQGEWFWIPSIYRKQEGELRFTLLTKPPNQVVRQIHRRMPVTLAKHRFQDWLEFSSQDFLDVEDGFPLSTHPVADVIDDETIDDERCVLPVPPRDKPSTDTSQTSLF